jgi:hypothetical protein
MSPLLQLYYGMSPESKQRQPLLDNGFIKTAVTFTRKWPSCRYVKAAPDAMLLEAVFSVRSVPRLYTENHPPLGDINMGTWPSRLGESQMRQ